MWAGEGVVGADLLTVGVVDLLTVIDGNTDGYNVINDQD